jgi:hypothetical protein
MPRVLETGYLPENCPVEEKPGSSEYGTIAGNRGGMEYFPRLLLF